MPLYDYQCGRCGTFSVWRAMEDRNLSVRCPQCHKVSARAISAPNLSLMSAPRRQAHSRNEKSQHEPAVRTSHHCASGCGCGRPEKNSRNTRPHSSAAAAGSSKTPRLQSSRKKNSRPWMLGH
jgi:putative FmdB family regulatory protein